MAGIKPSLPAPRARLGALVLLVILLVGGVILSRYAIGAMRASQAPAGELRLSISPVQDLVPFKTMPFEVTVRTAEGLPLEGAEVRFDLTMPEMAMPLNRFAARPVAGRPGLYRGEGSFTMGGHWLIEATARRGEQSGVGSRHVEIRGR
ncbi:MAG TPA: FixH family protein [Pantanalinema sp.]